MSPIFIEKRIAALSKLKEFGKPIDSISSSLIEALEFGDKIITCGNGGSEANHLTTELMGRFLKSRASVPSVCLNANCDVLTCLGNDYGFDQVFSRQLQGIACQGDVLLCFTTSGNSQNVTEVLKMAKKLGVYSIAILGKDGGLCKGLASQEIILPSDETAIIQEMSLALIHYWCGRIDERFV